MKLRKRIFLLVMALMSSALMAQSEEEKPSLDNGTIKSQFNYLIDESNDYQEYKVIRKTWVNKFEGNFNDTLEAIQAEKEEAATLIENQQKEISALKSQLAKIKDSLEVVIDEKNSIALVGVPMEKPLFKTIMWTIVAILLVSLMIFILRFKRSNVVSTQAKGNVADLEEELAEYKKRSLEREQKLRRQLQDEINKQRGA